MSSSSSDPIRDAVRAGRTLYNGWLGLGTPMAPELAAEAGFDMLTIDQQHGYGGQQELMTGLLGARAAGRPALVRVVRNDEGLIGRALDAGAQGVVVPMVNKRADALAVLAAVKYPPLGARSTGPYRGRLVLEGDYFAQANGWTIAAIQIETGEALGNLDEILSVKGVDMVVVGPNDLAITLSNGAARDVKSATMQAALAKILAGCKKHGVIAGIFANDVEMARDVIAKGWQSVALSSDGRWYAQGAAAFMSAVKAEGAGSESLEKGEKVGKAKAAKKPASPY